MAVNTKILKNLIKKSTIYFIYKKIKVFRNSLYIRYLPKTFIIREHKKLYKEKIDIDTPVLLSEKIQWLKLYYRDPLMVTCADKLLVRDYVKSKIGEEYLNDLLFTYDSVNDVDFSILPNQFVFKPNNSSGRVIICKDKLSFDESAAKQKMKKWEKENLYYITGEWIYKDLQYKLICEKFLEDNITDYKMYFTYDQFIATQVISERRNGFFIDYYDEKWNHLDIKRIDHNNNSNLSHKPLNYETMIEKGRILAAVFPFSRIDFYNLDGRIYLGEVSFFPNNGFIKFINTEMDNYFANKIVLPKQTFYSIKSY